MWAQSWAHRALCVISKQWLSLGMVMYYNGHDHVGFGHLGAK